MTCNNEKKYPVSGRALYGIVAVSAITGGVIMLAGSLAYDRIVSLYQKKAFLQSPAEIETAAEKITKPVFKRYKEDLPNFVTYYDGGSSRLYSFTLPGNPDYICLQAPSDSPECFPARPEDNESSLKSKGSTPAP